MPVLLGLFLKSFLVVILFSLISLSSVFGESAKEGGYDCSAFVSLSLMETARAWPKISQGGRTTAAGLYSYFNKKGCPDITKESDLRPGCLVFYRNTRKRITHIAIHAVTVPNIRLTEYGKKKTVPVGPVAFESGGAGSKAVSPRTALRDSAGIRITASTYSENREWVAKDPFYLLQNKRSGFVTSRV